MIRNYDRSPSLLIVVKPNYGKEKALMLVDKDCLVSGVWFAQSFSILQMRKLRPRQEKGPLKDEEPPNVSI